MFRAVMSLSGWLWLGLHRSFPFCLSCPLLPGGGREGFLCGCRYGVFKERVAGLLGGVEAGRPAKLMRDWE